MRYTEINSGKHPENTFPGSIQTREIENEVERMRKRKWRILSLLLVAVMTLGILFGCSKDGGEKGSGGKGGKKDTIIIATMAEPPTLSPTEQNAIASSYMNALTFSQLTRMNEDMEMEGALAESFENTSET